MRIGFDAKRLFNNFTGLGNYSRHVVKTLAENFPQQQLCLYTPRVNAHTVPDFLKHHKNISIKVPTGLMNLGPFRSYWRSVAVRSNLRKDSINLYHGLSNELPYGIRKTGIKSIVTIHDLLFLRYPELYPSTDRKIYNIKFRYACQAADKVIAVSQQTANDVAEFYKIPEDKIEVVYQSCNDLFKRTWTAGSLSKVIQKYKLPQDFILNVGTIEKRKNALLILQAMEQLKHTLDLHLVIVGKATHYLEEIRQYAAAHGLENRLYILHNVSYEDLPLIYRAAKLFVYPSVFEGFGIPIIEALYSGVPVITSKGSCFGEAGGPESLYADPYSSEELAQCIEQVLTDSVLTARMICRGLDHAHTFDNEAIATEIMKVYKQLV
jgi:glycosyltransferase involved in cell wall biosynthesis